MHFLGGLELLSLLILHTSDLFSILLCHLFKFSGYGRISLPFLSLRCFSNSIQSLFEFVQLFSIC